MEAITSGYFFNTLVSLFVCSSGCHFLSVSNITAWHLDGWSRYCQDRTDIWQRNNLEHCCRCCGSSPRYRIFFLFVVMGSRVLQQHYGKSINGSSRNFQIGLTWYKNNLEQFGDFLDQHLDTIFLPSAHSGRRVLSCTALSIRPSVSPSVCPALVTTLHTHTISWILLIFDTATDHQP